MCLFVDVDLSVVANCSVECLFSIVFFLTYDNTF